MLCMLVVVGSDETDCEGSIDNDDDISSDEDTETRKLDSDVSTRDITHSCLFDSG